MHVLYIHQYFTTRQGAGGTRSYEMAKALVAQGHRVTMVCGSGQRSNTGLSGEFRRGFRVGDVEGIRVIEIDLGYSNHHGLLARSWLFCRFAGLGLKVAMTSRYDVAFASSTPLTASIPGIIAKALRAKPFIFEVRDLWPELPREMGVVKNPVLLGLLGALEWLSYHTADLCIGLSPGICRGIERRGVAQEKVRLISNGSDVALFRPVDRAERSRFGLDPEHFLAVFSGAHGLANGLDSVLDAAEVLKRNPEAARIRLLLVGDGKLKPRLVARAREDGLDNVIFMDSIPKHELAVLLGSCDVGMMILADCPAFQFGTSPNKFFDYIAAGLPVVNNYDGWLAGMIRDNNCGKVSKPGDVKGLANALIELARLTPVELKLIGERSRNLAMSTFLREDLARQFVHALESVIKDPREISEALG